MRTLSIAALLCLCGTTHAQLFRPLGFLPGGTGSWITGVSADGDAVTGSCSGESEFPQSAFRWTLLTGMVDLGVLIPTYPMMATGISADGTKICGTAADMYGTLSRAFRWVEGVGLTDLGIVAPFCSGAIKGLAISGDGRTVVGWCAANGLRWFEPDGMHLFSGNSTWSGAIHKAASQDGTIICGQALFVPTLKHHGYRLTIPAGTVVDVGVLPGDDTSNAVAISADGSVIVGSSSFGTSGRILRWTAATGATEIPKLAGWTTAAATAVSADGSIAAGTYTTATSRGGWISAPNIGTHDVAELLTSLGLDLSGWQKIGIAAVNVDGATLVGDVFDSSNVRHGLIIKLPRPLICYANCDGSTSSPVLNTNDFQCFLNRFAAGESYANCDGSTAPPVLNANDFQCFLNKYAIGCS